MRKQSLWKDSCASHNELPPLSSVLADMNASFAQRTEITARFSSSHKAEHEGSSPIVSLYTPVKAEGMRQRLFSEDVPYRCKKSPRPEANLSLMLSPY
jgi:hypothetical protein